MVVVTSEIFSPHQYAIFSRSVLARLYVVVRTLAKANDRLMELKAGPLPEDIAGPGQPAGEPAVIKQPAVIKKGQ